jgi:hypothetical protein
MGVLVFYHQCRSTPGKRKMTGTQEDIPMISFIQLVETNTHTYILYTNYIYMPQHSYYRILAMVYNFQRYWGFRTLSIVQVLKDKTKEKHDVSETGSVSVFR